MNFSPSMMLNRRASGILESKESQMAVKGSRDLKIKWCRRRGSNPHGFRGHWILSPARLPIPPHRHDVFFDDKRRRIYASCGDGKVDVWQEEVGVYHPLSTVRTATGARTSLFVPELDRLFVAARAGFFGLGSAAAILVLRPAD